MTPTLTRAGAAVSLLAASTLLLSACNDGGLSINSDKNAGSAAPSSAAGGGDTQAPVDLAALDTGKYPTTPRPEFGRPDDNMILQVEGQRLAQFVMAPFEVDPDLRQVKLPTGVIAGHSGLTGFGAVLSKELAEVPANNDLMYGFTTTASTPAESLRSGTDRSLNNVVLRYPTPADAKAAAEQMAAVAAGDDNARSVQLPGLPDTLAIRQKSVDGNPILMTLTPVARNEFQGYVQYQWFEVDAKDEAKLEPTITQMIPKQSELIKQFPGAMTKDEAKAKNITGPTRPLMDQNKVLIYALPYSDAELEKGGASAQHERAVYGPRGMAHFASDPALAYNTLTDTGSTANASERSTVYRAETADGGTKIYDTFVKEVSDGGETKVDSPKGLPGASCSKGATASGSTTFYRCFVKNGRYVGEVSSDQSLNDAHQQAAAQYVLLSKADQNAQ